MSVTIKYPTFVHHYQNVQTRTINKKSRKVTHCSFLQDDSHLKGASGDETQTAKSC